MMDFSALKVAAASSRSGPGLGIALIPLARVWGPKEGVKSLEIHWRGDKKVTLSLQTRSLLL